MEDFGFKISELSGATVLKLNEQLTQAEIPDFEAQAAQLTARKPARLIIDMSDLQMLSSAGVGALIKLNRQTRNLKCDLRLAALPTQIEAVIRASKLDSIFKISPTLSDATA